MAPVLAADPFAADPFDGAGGRAAKPPRPPPSPSTVTGRGPVTGRPAGSELIPRRSQVPVKELLGAAALLIFLAVLGVGLFPRIFGGFSNVPAINDFAAGTCFIIEGPGIFSDIPCSAPHDGEVVGWADWDGTGDYPGSSVLEDWANASCIERFTEFVGIDPDSSILALGVLYPSESSWNNGDRRAICAVQFSDIPEIGSVRQSLR